MHAISRVPNIEFQHMQFKAFKTNIIFNPVTAKKKIRKLRMHSAHAHDIQLKLRKLMTEYTKF